MTQYIWKFQSNTWQYEKGEDYVKNNFRKCCERADMEELLFQNGNYGKNEWESDILTAEIERRGGWD